LTKQLGAFADGTDGIDVLNLHDDDASASIKIQAPGAVTSDTTLTLPDGDGADGQAIITNGSGTLAWAYPYGNRNMVVNGAMLLSQRGTSFTSVADNAYTLDRYRLTENTSAVVDMSQSSEAPSEGGFSSSLKIDITTAATPSGGQAFALNYRMEGYDFLPSDYGHSNAKYLTLSFWVKSNVTGTYRLTFIARNGSGNRSIGATYTINSADTWEKKEVSIIPDTASTPYQTTDEGFRIEWYLASGPDRTTGSLPTSWATLDNATRATGQGVNLASSTSNEWYITGVQLEVGSATPFEHEPYGVTLQKAQRFFQVAQAKVGLAGTTNGSTEVIYIGVPLNVPLRSAPTLSGPTSYTARNTSVASGSSNTPTARMDNANSCILSIDATGFGGFTDNRFACLHFSGGDLKMDAEL